MENGYDDGRMPSYKNADYMRTYFLRKPQLYLFRILQECLIYIQTAESCIYHTNIKKKQQRLFIVVPKEGTVLCRPSKCFFNLCLRCLFNAPKDQNLISYLILRSLDHQKRSVKLLLLVKW